MPNLWLAPNHKERTVMLSQCGNKCFLGPKNSKSFPICTRKTCNINKKGLRAAYKRAREYGSPKMRSTRKHPKSVYRAIAQKSRKMLAKK